MSPGRAAAVLLAVLATALAIAAWSLHPPAARGVDAPATAFSAGRALRDVGQIAQRPHPIGSPDSIRVRGYLVGRLRGLGLETSVRSFAVTHRNGAGGLAHDILGVLPGTDRKLPAIMLMSHYDSVPTGPGAGDDAAGVAASLEVARALKALGPHRRDIMVLITDGEEAGLLGARAFFGEDDLRNRPGLILNLEARGDRGRAVMFETHRDAAPLVRRLIGAGALSGASSLMPDLYRRLPNDTDLTEALARGHMGLNFAFFEGQAHYHQPTDTPANLDPGSLQHIGDQVLAAASAVVDEAALPGLGPDEVYIDLLGGPVVRYPAWAGWLILVAAAVLGGGAAGRSRVAPRDAAIGAGISVLMLAASGAVLFGAAPLLGDPAAFGALLGRYPIALSGFALLGAGAACLVLAVMRRALRGVGAPVSWWMGVLAVGLAAALFLQVAAPLDAFVAAWPVVAGALAAALVVQGSSLARALALAIGLLATAQVFYWAGLMFGLVGVGMPVILAAFTGLALMTLTPLAQSAAGARGAIPIALGLCVLGAALLGWTVST